MLTINTKLDITPSYPLQTPWNWEDILFFDIETTGFSANTSYLYLIGCMYYSEDSWNMIQWLAEDISSEILILEAFFQKMKSYKKLVHYNGSGFDIPYLIQKCNKYNITCYFDTIESFDIYKKLLPFKKLLPLANLKLKTVEAFVNTNRKDTFSGEELIKVYSSFVGRLQYEKLHQKRLQTNTEIIIQNPSDSYSIEAISSPSSNELMDLLLLHNKEDIEGLIKIADLLYFADAFQVNLLETNYKTELFPDEANHYYSIQVTLPFTLPTSITLRTPLHANLTNAQVFNRIILDLNHNLLQLQIPIYKGELKYFFDNYKEYYYLPQEDTAIHKSVSQYVDKEFRVQAKAYNCYQKVSGNFLPQPNLFFSPGLKFDFNDKFWYFDTTNKDFQNPAHIQEYITRWIQSIINNNSTVLD
jgi:uncharacterized protein YprB with RNaseH-like and TPR domain